MYIHVRELYVVLHIPLIMTVIISAMRHRFDEIRALLLDMNVMRRMDCDEERKMKRNKS